MTETHSLLKDFSETGSESAFRQLVVNYIDLVYSTALRRAGGDTHRAEDITQTVFADLARKAKSLPPNVMLGGWLHRHCWFVANTVCRSESRRIANEQEAVAMETLQSHQPAWSLLAPILDDGIEQLESEDRDALILRFFESKNFREVGECIGASDNAAQKRVARALEKLRDHFVKCGVTLSLAVLTEHLGAHSVQAAPAPLSAQVTQNALKSARVETAAAVGAGAGFLFGLFKIAAVAAVAGGILWVALPKKSPSLSDPSPAQKIAGAAQPATGATDNPPTVAAAPAPADAASTVVSNIAGLRLTLLAADSGQAIPNVPIEYRAWEGSKVVRKNLSGSRTGLCVVPISSNITRLELTTRVEGFADTHLQWRADRGDKIPDAYTLRLGRGVRIGGKVVDARGELVPGAKIGFNNQPDPELSLKIESNEFSWIEVTAEDGHWEIDRIAEPVLRRIYGGASHSNYVQSKSIFTEQDPDAIKQLRALDYTFTLGDAVTVTGTVVNHEGQPIADAEILVGQRSFSGSRAAQSRADGSFQVEGCTPGKTVLTGSAKGYAAKTIPIEASAEAEPFKLALEPGYVLRMRLVGKQGEPVRGAHVWLNTMDHGPIQEKKKQLVQADFSPRSDAEGHVVWFEAPAKELTFDIQGAGYMRANEVSIPADGVEHVITLAPAINIYGTVRDADKGTLIPRFRIISGWQDEAFNVPGAPPPMNNWSTMDRFWFSFADGKFDQKIDEPVIYGAPKVNYVFKFEADGYAPFITRVVHEAEGKVKFDVALKPAGASKLTVLATNGKPAPNIDVVFAAARQFVSIHNAGFSRRSDIRLRTTDANGQVSWEEDPAVVSVIVSGPAGFAQAAPSELPNPPVLQLQSWGRVEGIVTRRGKPITGWVLRIGSPPSSPLYLRPEKTQTTDENGHFSFDGAPPGAFTLVRVLPLPDNSSTDIPLRDISIQSAETTRADFNENGITATLRVIWPKDISDPSQFTIHAGAYTPPPGWTPDLMKDPQRLAEWQNRPEVKAAAATMRNIQFGQKSPGLLSAEGFQPGHYNINAFGMPRNGGPSKLTVTGSLEITIPSDPSLETMDLGELTLTATPASVTRAEK